MSNDHWCVTAFVSGLIAFDNIDLLEGLPSRLPESLYLRDLADDSLRAVWRAVLSDDEAALLSFPWTDEERLPPYSKDFYRN